MLSVTPELQIPLRELSFHFVRSRGPGGQHVNKASTKAVLRWRIVASPSLAEDVKERFLAKYRRRVSAGGELILSSERFRSQGRNVADCLEKLRGMLADVAQPPVMRKATKPTKAARRRRVEEKRQRGEKKQRRRPPAAED